MTWLRRSTTTSETSFGIALAHALAAAAATLYGTKDAIDVGCTTPFLVSEDIDIQLFLSTLNKLNICKHTLTLELLRQLCGHRCCRVKPSKRYQLKNKSADRQYIPLLNFDRLLTRV